MAEVKTELLWTTNVTPAPTNMAMNPVSHPNGYGRSVEIKKWPACLCNKHSNTCIFCILYIRLLHVDTQCKTCSSPKESPPVLMTLWMTFATWPPRRELSSLTRSSRQVQRTAREPARRIRPTVRSDSSVDTNKCLPAEWRKQQSSGYYPTNSQFYYIFNRTNTEKKMHTRNTQSTSLHNSQEWVGYRYYLVWTHTSATTGRTHDWGHSFQRSHCQTAVDRKKERNKERKK